MSTSPAWSASTRARAAWPDRPSRSRRDRRSRTARRCCRRAGATLEDVVEVGVLLIDPQDFAGMNEEYANWFTGGRPARYAAKLGAEIPGVLVSIRMTGVHRLKRGFAVLQPQ